MTSDLYIFRPVNTSSIMIKAKRRKGRVHIECKNVKISSIFLTGTLWQGLISCVFSPRLWQGFLTGAYSRPGSSTVTRCHRQPFSNGLALGIVLAWMTMPVA